MVPAASETPSRNKYKRARLSSTQLSLLRGSMEMWDTSRARRVPLGGGRRHRAIGARPYPASRRDARLPLRDLWRRSSVTGLRDLALIRTADRPPLSEASG